MQLGDLGVVVAENGLENIVGVLAHARGARQTWPGVTLIFGAMPKASTSEFVVWSTYLIQSPRERKCSFSVCGLGVVDNGAGHARAFHDLLNLKGVVLQAPIDNGPG